MVLGSQSSRVATYSIPPCPSLAASMAAYRLRSFSESESWNIRMECSISGLYIMGGRPLRGLDGSRYGYTVRREDREVIELAILTNSRRANCSWAPGGPWSHPTLFERSS